MAPPSKRAARLRAHILLVDESGMLLAPLVRRSLAVGCLDNELLITKKANRRKKPPPDDPPPLSKVRCESQLGGLLKHYYCQAAQVA